MSESDRAPIPKFGSFHPKRKISSTEDSANDRQASARKDTGHRRRSQDRERQSRRGHDRTKVAAPASKAASKQKSRNVSPIVDVRPDDFFIVDHRGDPKNLEYGSIHRYHVPSFYRVGRGRVLGAPDVRLGEHSTARGAVLVSDDRYRTIPERPLASKNARGPRKEYRVIASQVANSLWDLESDEIHFRRPESDMLASAHGSSLESVDYRSIEGKAKDTDQPEDEDLEFVPETLDKSIGSTEETRVRQEHALLTRKSKETPQDLSSWLRLVEYQKQVLFPGVSQKTLATSERRALADIRLSIYHQAQKHFSTQSSEMETILLGIMAEREAVLEPTQVAKRWLEIIREYPNSVKLWVKYLDHLQSSHYDFKFETCKAGYIQCLKIISDAGGRVADPRQLLMSQAHILSRLTAFIRDAGYTELANSVLQAVLELCLSHSGLSVSEPDLTAFEAFWESDAARIGENGSLGFTHFEKHGTAPSRTPLGHIDDKVDEVSFREFAQRESKLGENAFLPATTTDDADDPFRFVMFADIKDMITPLLPSISIDVVVNVFSVHHSLPPLYNGQSYRDWQLDEYIVQSTTKIECRPVSLAWLFSTAFDNFKSTHEARPESHLVRFIDRVLDKLCLDMPAHEAFSEYYIAFKMHVLPQELGRAKKLIKARPHSTRLYNAYALAEAGLGKLDKAREVWRLASGMGSGPQDASSQYDLQTLYCSWIQTEVSTGNEAGIPAVFARMVTSAETSHKGGMNSVFKLRVSDLLQRQWANAIDQKLYHIASDVAECMAIFQYVTEDYDLEAVMDTIRHRSKFLPADIGSEALELLHEAKARILDSHLRRHRAYKPARIRDELRASLKLYPNNTLFLRMYADHESRFDFNDRIRVPFRDELTDEQSSALVTLAFAVEQELERYSKGAGGASEHSVRNLFVRILLQPSPVQHSFAVWKSWFLFEHPDRLEKTVSAAQRERMMGKAKQVFLDGLRHLPWHKGWAMIGMGSACGPGGMTEMELRQGYEVLLERELRIRIEV